MAWTPDDDELARVWLATQDLVRRGKLVFNVSRRHGSGVPATARDLLVEINEHGLDLMRGGSCIYPPTKVLDLLASERGVDPGALFSKAEVESQLAEIARVDALIAEASANERSLTESVARSIGGIRSSGRGVLESVMAFALVIPLSVFALLLLDRYSAHAKIFLGVFLAGFALTALELIRGVVNPARLFREAEALRGAPGLSSQAKRSVVHYVARDVAYFFALFVATAAAYHAVDPGAFITESEAPGVIAWLAYGLDNLIRTVGLDIAEVFGFHVSTITHANALLPQLLVFTFRTLFSVVGIALIAGANRRYGTGTVPGTNPPL